MCVLSKIERQKINGKNVDNVNTSYHNDQRYNHVDKPEFTCEEYGSEPYNEKNIPTIQILLNPSPLPQPWHLQFLTVVETSRQCV